MRKKKINLGKFKIPENFFDQLYELSGSLDKNKGFIVFYIDENGSARVRQKFDSQATEFAINKIIEIFLNDNSSMHCLESEDEFSDEDDDWLSFKT